MSCPPRPWRAARVPGLFFIGEVVDVTGQFGGFNFQWAWARARRRARGLCSRMPVESFLHLTIEKLIYGGDGLCRLPPDERGRSKAVFVPFVLAGEKVEATLAEKKSSFARAKVEAVIEASPRRIEPGCPYFGAVRRMSLPAHGLRASTRDQDRNFARELAAHREARIDPRDRGSSVAAVELPQPLAVAGPTEPAFAPGYFKIASHQLLPVEKCPISSPLINRGIASLGKAAAPETFHRES